MTMFLPAFFTTLLFFLFDLVLSASLGSKMSFSGMSTVLSLMASLSFWLGLVILVRGTPRFLRSVFIAFVSVGITLIMGVSFFSLWKLGDYINTYMLMFVSVDKGFVADQIQLYGLDPRVLVALPVWFLFYLIWRMPWRQESNIGRIENKPVLFALFLGCVVVLLVSLNQLKYETLGQRKTPDASLLLAIKSFQKSTRLNVLRSSVRLKVVSEGQIRRPDLFIFLGESLGRQYFKIFESYRVGRGLVDSKAGEGLQTTMASEKKLELGKAGAGALLGGGDASPNMTRVFGSGASYIFRNAISNSSCTDVSLPSLFSGVGPEEPDQKLHDVPLIWDWLKANGYHTVFASPQKFAFANFDSFIMSPGPDQYLSADRYMSLQRLVMAHNNGLDDIWAAKRVVEEIEKVPRDKPLALIFFTNATHYPFLQTSTELVLQPGFSDPYLNSLWITDQAFETLYRGISRLRDERRLMTIVSADHGELVHHWRPVPRISSFYDEILGAPLMIRLPEDFKIAASECHEGLRVNQNRLVQNLDVLPTILELLGIGKTSENARIISELRGRSLCHDVGKERDLIALNTNNIRQWNPEGFLIARDGERLVFSNTEGLRYFDVNQDPDQKVDMLSQMSVDRRARFEELIDGNLQLLRIKNLYFKQGLFGGATKSGQAN